MNIKQIVFPGLRAVLMLAHILKTDPYFLHFYSLIFLKSAAIFSMPLSAQALTVSQGILQLSNRLFSFCSLLWHTGQFLMSCFLPGVLNSLLFPECKMYNIVLCSGMLLSHGSKNLTYLFINSPLILSSKASTSTKLSLIVWGFSSLLCCFF
jgi:hypothetical protein